VSLRYQDIVEQHRDRIPSPFDSWVRAHGIEDEVAPILYTVTTWVKHCSPPHASTEQLALACMDLAVSFFYLDDYEREDDHELFAQYEMTLTGEPAAGLNAPSGLRRNQAIIRAHADLLGKLQSMGHPMQEYVAEERRLLAEYRYRNSTKRGHETLTYDRYRDCRLVTIYVYQWLELWQLLDHFPVSAHERASPIYQDAVRLTATFFVLGNELYSLDRDIRNREPNLVCILADEQAIPLTEAARRIALERDEVARAFETLRADLSVQTGALRKCGQLLDQCVRAATAARHDNPGRYTPPAVY